MPGLRNSADEHALSEYVGVNAAAAAAAVAAAAAADDPQTVQGFPDSTFLTIHADVTMPSLPLHICCATNVTAVARCRIAR